MSGPLNVSLIELLLVLLVLGGLALAAVCVSMWWRQVDLIARVTHLEAGTKNAPTHGDMRRIQEELANIRGEVSTTKQLMQTTVKHLLESKPQ